MNKEIRDDIEYYTQDLLDEPQGALCSTVPGACIGLKMNVAYDGTIVDNITIEDAKHEQYDSEGDPAIDGCYTGMKESKGTARVRVHHDVVLHVYCRRLFGTIDAGMIAPSAVNRDHQPGLTEEPVLNINAIIELIVPWGWMIESIVETSGTVCENMTSGNMIREAERAVQQRVTKA
ncbi:hypothetical protein BDR05DRAFT_989608 [Suillus weaverae]|nr:hypothetical protein BDR05DRAFT_989608 [Suillus weaverae]